MSEAEQKTASLLTAMWLRIRPIVEERMVALDGAADAVAAGSLSEELRKEAHGSAHKLAGSLGMYGFDEGTRIAQQLEVLLESMRPDSARLTALVVELRQTIFPNR